MSAPESTPKRTGLLLIDVQNGFVPGGTLAVPEGNLVAQVCNALRAAFVYALVVLSQDFHPAGHASFASTWDAPTFSAKMIPAPDGSMVKQIMWPDHCVQGTPGADFCADLERAPGDIVIQKGTNQDNDSYSAFYDNGKFTDTGLSALLKSRGITHLVVAGLAFNYCVAASVIDAIDEGFKVCVVMDGCRSVLDGTADKVKDDLIAKGAILVQTVAEATAWANAA